MEYHASDNCTAGSKDLYKFYFSVMIIEFILALPLNLTVIYLFIFKLQFWKSKSNNIFLFNLVLADILLLICLPVRAYYFQRGERRSNNNTVCKSVLFMLFLNRGASIAFLTIISINRYLSVVHPGIKNPLKIRKRSVLISVLVWVLLMPLTIPSLLTTFECCNNNETGEETSSVFADNATAETFRELVFFTPVLISSIVLVYCTIRITNRLKEKTVGDRTKLRRAVFLVTLVVSVFAFCFWPSAISRLVLLVVREKNQPSAEEIAVQVYDGLMCLSYLDCLLDPIVYCLSSTKFKRVYISTYLPFLMRGHHAEHH